MKPSPVPNNHNRGAALVCSGLVVVGALHGCRRDAPASVDTAEAITKSTPEDPWLVDIARPAGLDFVHTTGSSGEYFFPEIAASGCALFDYDNDGDLDVYAVQAHALDPAAPRSAGSGANRLFRNDLSDSGVGTVSPRFVDVTEHAGVGDTGYGMGATIGDYDNDGDLDLLVTNFGPNVLYRNDGDGTFTDVTATALPDSGTWSTSAAFVDYDKDSLLDLFVVSYVNFTMANHKVCHSRSSRRDYCGPQSFDAVPDHLYRNNGDATFSDVTQSAGIQGAYGSGLGVVCADFDGDDWPDIHVANDGNANHLWINGHDGTFENNALMSGAAYNGEGVPEAGMGVTAGDFDLDGDWDIFLAHLVGEHNTLLVNNGRGVFEDRTDEHALGGASRPFTAFGVQWFDFNGDTYLDLLVANGAVKIAEAYAHLDYPYPFPNQLFINSGPPAFAFEDRSAQAGPSLTTPEVSRGAAFGDVDNDGDIDVLISNSNGPLCLLRNDVGHKNAWLSLKLIGTESNRSAIGAIVRLERDDAPTLRRRVHADGSYCGANDLRVYFGLADDRKDQTVTVQWPNGLTETFQNLSINKETALIEGHGNGDS